MTSDHGFTNIPTSTINDMRLSHSALGLLCQLLSYDEVESFDPAVLAEQSTDSPAEVAEFLAELVEHGYLVDGVLYDTSQTDR